MTRKAFIGPLVEASSCIQASIVVETLLVLNLHWCRRLHGQFAWSRRKKVLEEKGSNKLGKLRAVTLKYHI